MLGVSMPTRRTPAALSARAASSPSDAHEGSDVARACRALGAPGPAGLRLCGLRPPVVDAAEAVGGAS